MALTVATLRKHSGTMVARVQAPNHRNDSEKSIVMFLEAAI